MTDFSRQCQKASHTRLRSGLSHLNQIPTKQFNKILLKRRIPSSRDDEFSDVLEVGDVENPSIRIQKDIGGGEPRALVSLLKRVSPNDSHHETYRKRGHILDFVVMIHLARSRRSAFQLMRFEHREWLFTVCNYAPFKFFEIVRL